MQINFNIDNLAPKLKPDVLKMLSSLKPGQTVSAKVASQDADGNTVLDFPAGRVSLNIEKQLKPGERVWFEASRDNTGNRDTGVSVILKLLDQPSESGLSSSSGMTRPGNTARNILPDLRTGQAADSEPGRIQTSGLSAKDSLFSLFEKGDSRTAVLSRMPGVMLKKGEDGQGITVPARVLKMTGNDRAFLSIKGEGIEAKVSVSLKEGSVIFLEKTKPGASAEFRILQPDNARSAKNLAALAQSEGGAGAFPRIVNLLSKFQIQPSVTSNERYSGPLPFKTKIENLIQTFQNAVFKSDSHQTVSARNLVRDIRMAMEGMQSDIKGGSEKINGLLQNALSGSSGFSSDTRTAIRETLDAIKNMPTDKKTAEAVNVKAGNLIQTLNDKAVNSDIPVAGSVRNLVRDIVVLLDKIQASDKALPEDMQKFFMTALSDSSGFSSDIKASIRILMNSVKREISDAGIRGKASVPLDAKMKDLMHALGDVSLKSENPQPDFIRNLVRNSGMSWENKLVDAIGKPDEMLMIASQSDDIKGILLDALSDSSVLPPDVGKTLEAALDSIENLQILNRISVSDGGVFVLPFPVFSDGTFTFGRIFFDFSDRQDKESKEKPFRVSVLLDMTALGKIRADLSFMKKSVSGSVIVESESSRQIFAENLPELEQKLVSQGFESASFGVRFSRNHDELESSSLFSKMVDQSDGLSLTV